MAFDSKTIFENIEKKIDEFVDLKEPEVFRDGIKKEQFISYLKNLQENEKKELIEQTNNVLEQKILSVNRIFAAKINSNNEVFTDIFLRMAKFYQNKYNIQQKIEEQQKIDQQYQSMSEKQILIEILKLIQKVIK